jgi:hypothetical protein
MRVLLRTIFLLTTLGVAAALMIACGDDDPVTTGKDCPSCAQPLTQKKNVLTNIELAYNYRRTDVYDSLLDNNFAFSYTDGDFGGGGTLVQWGRDEETSIHDRIFNDSSVASFSLNLDLDAVTWAESPSLGAPAETWYATTVFYNYTFKRGDTTYIPLAGSKVMFTVRNAGTDAAPHWQLVDMKDLGGPTVEMSSAGLTEANSWGQIKALYR